MEDILLDFFESTLKHFCKVRLMLNKIVFVLSLLTLSPVLWAQSVQVNPDHPEQYVIQRGDTLWDISSRFLSEPWRWPEIWQVNPEIENPHLIYPGDIVRLVYDGDTPVLTVQRGAGSDRTVRLSPTIRSEARPQAISSIPIEAIRHFLTRPLIVGEDEMNDWPYIVSSYEQHLVASPGVEVYIRRLEASGAGNSYSIYRKGPAYISKSDGKDTLLGYEAIYVGDAQARAYGDPSTAVITRAVREIKNGDRLIVQPDDEIYSSFIPTRPDISINASIISAQDVLSEIGQYKVVVLDKGAASGIQVGNVFGVYQSGKVVTDKIAVSDKKFNSWPIVEYLGRSRAFEEQITLPEVRAGVIMVFRTFDKVSYALVMEALRPIHLYDTVKSL